MFNIVLFEPEIPDNTGNIIRLSANGNFHLHLIRPYGFIWDDKRLKRSQLDYEALSHIQHHNNWDCFLEYLATQSASARLYAFTTKASQLYTEVSFCAGDFLLFGPESRGLPTQILHHPLIQQRLRLPMQPHSRSLNLANCVAIALFEAWRQNQFRVDASP